VTDVLRDIRFNSQNPCAATFIDNVSARTKGSKRLVGPPYDCNQRSKYELARHELRCCCEFGIAA
jgi:hypothetical protein